MRESKLNHEAIEAFAELFTKRACDSFFEGTDTISGKEIVDLTPVKQVNYFVLKILFRKWQKETLRLQSPYFNYKNEDVRKALLSFMNALSQQIKVNRVNFEPLLQQATREAILLIVSPYDFFREELTGHESGKLNDKYLKNSSKYIKVNQEIFESYVALFEEKAEGELSHDDAVVLLDELFAAGNLSMENRQEYEERFSEVAQVDFSTFVEEEDSSEEDDDDNDDDFDENPEEEESETSEDEEDDSSMTVEDRGPAETAEEDEDDELIRFVDEEEGDEEDEKPSYDALEEVQETQPEEEVKGKGSFEFLGDEESDDDAEPDAAPLNKQFSSEKTPLHEQLKADQRPSLAEVHQSQKIDSIAGSITVNQRYMFVNELFDGDSDVFLAAMKKVEGCDSFDDAVELLIQTYSKKLEWDMNAPEVKELLKIVFKKFR
ncbi:MULTISPECIES: hypothetical protein [unclassified Imperialibacter]|uniref:hypothetical protein n=1 Tax=unclassified Imperialibacter TaxID=2629706 RepID=UPI0012593E40|nr:MULTISPECIES: hypothetical protein [unclassified Imperialibacter]CAD5268428.1 conserved hypothetical protein [Imperialibacter sp. 89]CAD5296938.1 conserved hypothetical protein [Imperialibacter sp. 75]VVT33959.1 conserved hypothetical protein [Imperialibacter sp. EC-SDR9]